jgi:hypothetical protein
MKSSSDISEKHELLVLMDDNDNIDGSGPATPPSSESFSQSNSLLVTTEELTARATGTSIRSNIGVNYVQGNIKQLEKMQRRVPPNLDLHYISSQIIAMGLPRAGEIRRSQSDERPDVKCTQKRRKQKSNDVNELAMFLERRHRRRYLLFNVSDENDDDMDRLLDRQVVHLPWGSPSPSKIIRRPPVASHSGACNKSSGTPSVCRIMDICYALHAYLSTPPRELFLDGGLSRFGRNPQEMCDERHYRHRYHLPIQTVACIYCSNGKTRTGVTIACYLRFCNSVPCSLSGFEIFCERRGIMSTSSSSRTQADKDVLSHIPPSLRQFFRNFDEVVKMRQFPHPEPLLLRSIQLQGVPVDELPCVDIWEHGDERRRIYSSHKQDGNTKDGRNDDTTQLNKWDNEAGSYTVGKLLLSQDFTLVCRFGGEFASDAEDPSKVLFRYVNNPNFLSGGDVLELNIAEVDMMRRYADSFDDEDFLLTLIFEDSHVSISDDNYEHGSRSGSQSLLSTGLAKFDGIIQHNERDVILQGWRVLSDAHLSRISLSERDYELFRNDLDSSTFKLICPGNHEIDFRSIALQFTNGDFSFAKAELMHGLFKHLFSSSMIESMKQLALDVTSPLDGTSNGVVSTQNEHVENQAGNPNLSQSVNIPDRPARIVYDNNYVCTWRRGSKVDGAEHKKSTIEIDHKNHDKSTPLEFLIFERSSMGEEAETSATIEHIYQPYIHVKNDKSLTDIIEQPTRNRITSRQGDCGATEGSAVLSTKGGQVSSVVDNPQEDMRDHRGHMRELNDLISNSVNGPSMINESNQEENMEKSSFPMNHDLLFEKYYQLLKMVRSLDGIYFEHGP